MSKPEQPTLSKTCTNCGQMKPLSAFLEMSDNQGTVYGSICSSCRKTTLEAEQRRKTEAEGSTTSESGKRIDTKSKVHDAIDKREQAERTEKEYYAERDSDELLSEEITDSKKQTALAERKHRETFLKKRTSFLSEPRTAPATTQSQTSGKENQVVENNNQVTAQETHQTKEETLKTGFDYSVGQQQGATTRFTGDSFLRFRQQIMGFAPVAKNANQTTQDKNQTKDPAEYIKDNWRPGSKR